MRTLSCQSRHAQRFSSEESSNRTDRQSYDRSCFHTAEVVWVALIILASYCRQSGIAPINSCFCWQQSKGMPNNQRCGGSERRHLRAITSRARGTQNEPRAESQPILTKLPQATKQVEQPSRYIRHPRPGRACRRIERQQETQHCFQIPKSKVVQQPLRVLWSLPVPLPC